MTYFARHHPASPCDVFLSTEEWKILYRLIHHKQKAPNNPYTITQAIDYLGELGSYKHSPSDGTYGVKSIWKGIIKLYDAIDYYERLMG